MVTGLIDLTRLIDNKKMSKSIGNVVDPHMLLKQYGIDGTRYFLMRDGNINIDPEFSLSTVYRRYKYDLAGQLGNLITRSFSEKINPSGTIPHQAFEFTAFESSINDKIERLPLETRSFFDQYNISGALENISTLTSDLNKLWTISEPWNLIKSNTTEAKQRLETVLFLSYKGLRIIGILASPVIPNSALKLLDFMQIPQNERLFSHALDFNEKPGRVIDKHKFEILFPMFKQPF